MVTVQEVYNWQKVKSFLSYCLLNYAEHVPPNCHIGKSVIREQSFSDHPLSTAASSIAVVRNHFS